MFALQGMKKVKGQDEKDILEKLSILFNKKINDWIKIDFSNWDNMQEERFDIIKSAILNKQLVQFTYYNSKGEVSKEVENNEQIVSTIIPKGKYAKFVIIGDVQNSVGQAWQEIWNMELKRKYTCDFEEYQNNSQDMQKQEIHIYIAIEG